MWSLFSRDPSKDFAYEINEVVLQDEKSFWILHKGKKKATSEPVSIFRYECKPNEESYMDLAKNALKRLKTLRHPSILTYIDSLETDKSIVIVTEYVEPLHHYLNNMTGWSAQQKEFALSWGILSVAKGLSFLNHDCKLVYANISSRSIFVSASSDWKISSFEYLTGVDGSPPYKQYYHHKLYNAPEFTDNSRQLNKNIDSWGLGCLIWEIYNGFLSEREKLKTSGKIPKKLCRGYEALISANYRSRCDIQDFIKKGRENNGFFKNTFIDSMDFLEEIQIRDSIEKNRFFSNLNNRVESFPVDIVKNKILSLILSSLEYGDASSHILEILFKIGHMLPENDYQKRIVPCIVKLFSSKDRSVRSKLLKEIEEYIELIPANLVNEQIFPNLIHGFLDSNPVIREQTVKSIYHLAPKLNNTNLNVETINQFKRISTNEPEGGIRTNMTICLGKIASHFQPQIRQNEMVYIFLNSLKDPFAPARIAGILSFGATQSFFTLNFCATRVMPALCHKLMDPDKSVRENAITTLKSLLTKIEKVSENPALIEQMESEVNKSGSNVSSKFTSGLSWAVSSLAAKLARSKPEEDTSSTSRIGNLPDSSITKSTLAERSTVTKNSDNEMETTANNFGTVDTVSSSANMNGDGWEDDEWEDSFGNVSLDEPPEPPSQTLNVYHAKESKSNESKPSSTEDGWSDFGQDDDLVMPKEKEVAPIRNNRSLAISTRSEQRKPAATKRGPMKLGAQKVKKTVDFDN